MIRLSFENATNNTQNLYFVFLFSAAPTGISIVGYNDGSTVQVVSGIPLALECLVSDARPAPLLNWYKNGVRIPEGKIFLFRFWF